MNNVSSKTSSLNYNGETEDAETPISCTVPE